MLEVSVQVSVLRSLSIPRNLNFSTCVTYVNISIIHNLLLALMKLYGKYHSVNPLLTQFELKKSLVEHLVQLLSCGHVLPVVDYVAYCMEMESLDQSHIRHFVAEVCTNINGGRSLLLRV